MKLRIAVLTSAVLLSTGCAYAAVALESRPTPEVTVAEPLGYILTEYNGELAIFEVGNDQPILRLEVLVDQLPERDITKIRQGIPAESLEQALTLAEDYE